MRVKGDWNGARGNYFFNPFVTLWGPFFLPYPLLGHWVLSVFPPYMYMTTKGHSILIISYKEMTFNMTPRIFKIKWKSFCLPLLVYLQSYINNSLSEHLNDKVTYSQGGFFSQKVLFLVIYQRPWDYKLGQIKEDDWFLLFFSLKVGNTDLEEWHATATGVVSLGSSPLQPHTVTVILTPVFRPSFTTLLKRICTLNSLRERDSHRVISSIWLDYEWFFLFIYFLFFFFCNEYCKTGNIRVQENFANITIIQ